MIIFHTALGRFSSLDLQQLRLEGGGRWGAPYAYGNTVAFLLARREVHEKQLSRSVLSSRFCTTEDRNEVHTGH